MVPATLLMGILVWFALSVVGVLVLRFAHNDSKSPKDSQEWRYPIDSLDD